MAETTTSCGKLATHAALLLPVVLMAAWLPELGGLGSSGAAFQNWHFLLMIVAVGFCMSEAVMAYRAFSGGHARQKRIHLALQTLAFVLITTAVIIIYKFHEDNNIGHLYSLHSWVGVLFYIAFTTQLLLGAGHFFFPGASDGRRAAFLPVHRWCGQVVFVLGFAALLLGLFDRQRLLPSTNLYDAAHVLPNVIAVALIVGAALVGFHISALSEDAASGRHEIFHDDSL